MKKKSEKCMYILQLDYISSFIAERSHYRECGQLETAERILGDCALPSYKAQLLEKSFPGA
jgi:hypothetical protein